MRSQINATLLLLLAGIASCSENPTERAKTTPSATGAPTPAPDESEEADLPVQISGAFLTTEFTSALPDIEPNETSITGRVEKDGVKVDLASYTVNGKVINTATGEVLQEFVVADQTDGNQFSINVKDTDFALATVKIEITDSGKKSSVRRAIADHGGTQLTAVDPEKVFDFSGSTSVGQSLTAKAYCDTTGPYASVMKTVAGVNVPIATMSEVPAIDLSTAGLCFAKISAYTGSTETSLLAPNERIGDFIGSGLAQGGSVGCLFAVMKGDGTDSSGTNDGKPKLYVFQDHTATTVANMRKTAYMKRCP